MVSKEQQLKDKLGKSFQDFTDVLVVAQAKLIHEVPYICATAEADGLDRDFIQKELIERITNHKNQIKAFFGVEDAKNN
jgi:hypothetical protein